MGHDISITYHGHSAFELAYRESTILIDPFITGNPVATVSADHLNPTHIILTHGHGDHLGDTVGIAKRTKAQVITTFECANYIESKGVENVVGHGVGGGKDYEFGRVKFTIAHHGSSAPDGTYMGAAAGALVTLGDFVIYHAGDTALTYDMKLLGEMHRIDVAMLPIGDLFTMDVVDALKAVEFLNPSVVIPMHYDTFDAIQADSKRFADGVEELGKDPLLLKPGECWSPVGASL